jgi:hypothetical protein
LTASRRSTVRLGLQPEDRSVTYTVVTQRGELKAAVMAAIRHARVEPDARIRDVEIIRVEEDVSVGDHDLLDYWESS